MVQERGRYAVHIQCIVSGKEFGKSVHKYGIQSPIKLTEFSAHTTADMQSHKIEGAQKQGGNELHSQNLAEYDVLVFVEN